MPLCSAAFDLLFFSLSFFYSLFPGGCLCFRVKWDRSVAMTSQMASFPLRISVFICDEVSGPSTSGRITDLISHLYNTGLLLRMLWQHDVRVCVLSSSWGTTEKQRPWHDTANSQASKHFSFLTILSFKILMLSVIRKLQWNTHILSKLPSVCCETQCFFFFISPNWLCGATASFWLRCVSHAAVQCLDAPPSSN